MIDITCGPPVRGLGCRGRPPALPGVGSRVTVARRNAQNGSMALTRPANRLENATVQTVGERRRTRFAVRVSQRKLTRSACRWRTSIASRRYRLRQQGVPRVAGQAPGRSDRTRDHRVLGRDTYQLYHATSRPALDGERTGFAAPDSDRRSARDLDSLDIPGPQPAGSRCAASREYSDVDNRSAWNSRLGNANTAAAGHRQRGLPILYFDRQLKLRSPTGRSPTGSAFCRRLLGRHEGLPAGRRADEMQS